MCTKYTLSSLAPLAEIIGMSLALQKVTRGPSYKIGTSRSWVRKLDWRSTEQVLDACKEIWRGSDDKIVPT